MFNTVLLKINGPTSDLENFKHSCLSEYRFSFNTLIPTPPSLEFDLNNFVEDGYCALYGEWTKLAGRWMFKEAAAEKGFEFPLSTREQVIECTKALGEMGEKRFELGKLFHANIDRYGHGHVDAWRKEHWGVIDDASSVVIRFSDESIDIAFNLADAPPKKLLALFSKPYPTLTFTITYVKENGKGGKSYRLRQGKLAESISLENTDFLVDVKKFRISQTLPWLCLISGNDLLVEQIAVDDGGHPILRGTAISVRFALQRLKSGVSAETLRVRCPEISDEHLKALVILSSVYERIRFC